MEFEINQRIDFEVGELASAAFEVVEDYLYDNEPDYARLNDKQRDMLLKAIFTRAIEILKEEEED